MIDYREDNKWIVYIHIIPKKISKYDYDKYYVGITSQENPERRWRNGDGYLNNSYFSNAIKKYGWDNIEHEIVAEHLTKDEACNMEVALIRTLHSNDKIHGYNLTNGGDGVHGFAFSLEQKQKMSEKRMGTNNGFYGKHHSEETKQIMSEHHYDCTGANNPSARPIYRFDINFNYICSYPSAADAERELNCRFVGSAALNKTLLANSYWARKDNIIISSDGQIHMKTLPVFNEKNHIFQFDKDMNFINRYISGGQASNITGFGASAINYAARKKILSNGYYWLRIGDVKCVDNVFTIKENTQKELLKIEENKNSRLVKVVNITTNEIFNSYALASKYYGVNYTNIKDAALGLAQGVNRTSMGYKWLRYDDYLKIYSLSEEEAKNKLTYIVS